MKIYIIQDQEGVSGIVEWEKVLAEQEPGRHNQARLLMTREINAAVEGALEAGAKEVYVHESHKFILNELHEDIKLVMGASRPQVDNSFDAMFMVGQHARARTDKGVLAHSYCQSAVREMFINEEPVGEIAFQAAYAGIFDVPVTLVTGDRAAVNEAEEALGSVVTASVKEGLGQHSAVCLSPLAARKLIKQKAVEAIGRCGECTPLKFHSPIELRIDYFNPLVIERAQVYPGVETVNPTTLRFKADDFMSVYKFRSFMAMIHAVPL